MTDLLTDDISRSAARVFLQVENRLLRETLVRLFRNRSDLQVVGQSGQPEISIPEIADSKCDLLLVASFQGKGLPAASLLEGLEQLSVKTILIGMEAEEEQFLAAVRAGVVGYLLKAASSADVVAAVRAVFRGEAVCPPQYCSTLFRLVAQFAKDSRVLLSTPRPDLTLRQQQLVALVAKGMTNKEIAACLNLSEFTVRNHIHRILKQVDAGTRSEAVENIRSYGYEIGA